MIANRPHASAGIAAVGITRERLLQYLAGLAVALPAMLVAGEQGAAKKSAKKRCLRRCRKQCRKGCDGSSTCTKDCKKGCPSFCRD